jgi:hypothetical protein
MIVVVDSTEFRRDRTLNKQDLAYLKDLGSKKLVKIHIPWFIYKESATHAILELETTLNKAKNQLASLDKNGIHPDDIPKVRQMIKQVDDFRTGVKDSNKKLWDSFIKESNATLHPFRENHALEVFEAYFDGGKPFKSIKNRADIPDAFIYMTIKELAKKDEVHLISDDTNLRDKCGSEKNVIVHKDFDSFFNTSKLQVISLQYQNLLEVEKIKSAKMLLLDYKDVFEDAVRRYTESLNFLELSDTSLNSDNGEVTIRAVDEPKVIIEESEIEFFSNQFYVPIVVHAIASVDYLIYKGDYWTYNDLPKFSEDWNEYYYLIEDTFPIIFRKTIIIDIDNFDEDTEPEIEIDEFDEIELEVSEYSNQSPFDDFSEPLEDF